MLMRQYTRQMYLACIITADTYVFGKPFYNTYTGILRTVSASPMAADIRSCVFNACSTLCNTIDANYSI